MWQSAAIEVNKSDRTQVMLMHYFQTTIHLLNHRNFPGHHAPRPQLDSPLQRPVASSGSR